LSLVGSTLLLLDTNAYLRLAKRIRPMLGVKFGQKNYEIKILKDVEDEVFKNGKLLFKFPWFENVEHANERLANQIRLSKAERSELDITTSILRGHVLSNLDAYKRSPPSPVDCRVLAFSQVRNAVIVTDDLGIHQLAGEFSIAILHGHELLKKMLSAKVITAEQVREMFEALEVNGDLPQSWIKARQTSFEKVFR
jgi:hypothetical protein